MRRIGPAIVIAALLPLSPSAGSNPSDSALPGWMSGCWEWREGERWGEECWTVPRRGQMMGSGRSGDAAKVASWEFMRIERDDEGLRFSASPGGTGWTRFASASDPGEGVTFVNPANDYPQRVRYWREGELLKAEISQLDGSREMGWSFARMGG